MRGGQHALGVDGQGHRRAQSLGQLQQGRRCIDGAATRQNQRVFGLGQKLAHLFNGSRRGAGAGNAHRLAGEQGVGILHQHVQRYFNMHRPRSAGLKQGKGPGQYAW